MPPARLILAAFLAWAVSPGVVQQPVIGLITKTETNPFFVKMKEGAAEAAKARGARLLTAAGKFDGDNASQVTAIENMMGAGAKAILSRPATRRPSSPPYGRRAPPACW
jgi:fructose transport system substrate-binding protein